MPIVLVLVVVLVLELFGRMGPGTGVSLNPRITPISPSLGLLVAGAVLGEASPSQPKAFGPGRKRKERPL
jgi:hypothetical protein